jgi:hypothetical protein
MGSWRHVDAFGLRRAWTAQRRQAGELVHGVLAGAQGPGSGRSRARRAAKPASFNAAQPLAATKHWPVPHPKTLRNRGAGRWSAAVMMRMFMAAVAKQSSGHGVPRSAHGVARRSDTMPGVPVRRQAKTWRAVSFACRATPCELRETPCPLDCFATARTSTSRPARASQPRVHGRRRILLRVRQRVDQQSQYTGIRPENRRGPR